MNHATGEIQVAGLIMREKYDRINLNVVVQDVAAPTMQTATGIYQIIFCQNEARQNRYLSNNVLSE